MRGFNCFNNGSLFKPHKHPSWTMEKNDTIRITKITPATNWDKFIIHNQVAGAFGTGYKVERYKRGKLGIKGVSFWPAYIDYLKLKKTKVFVKVKNKPNHIKAVEHLGKYAQHKPLLNEVIKTLDFLDR